MRILDYVFTILCLAVMADSKPVEVAKEKHILRSIPGLVPVFIRSGNIPLEEINENLANAFYFNSVKHGRLTFGRDISSILNEKERSRNLLNISDTNNDRILVVKNKKIDDNKVNPKVEKIDTHVQKIPKH